jgi:hypothetical protein
MSDLTQLTQHALMLLRESPDYVSDARAHTGVHNTIVGSLMSLTLHAPRQYTEQAVRAALAELDAEAEP